jgi:hypothetical protein
MRYPHIEEIPVMANTDRETQVILDLKKYPGILESIGMEETLHCNRIEPVRYILQAVEREEPSKFVFGSKFKTEYLLNYCGNEKFASQIDSASSPQNLGKKACLHARELLKEQITHTNEDEPHGQYIEFYQHRDCIDGLAFGAYKGTVPVPKPMYNKTVSNRETALLQYEFLPRKLEQKELERFVRGYTKTRIEEAIKHVIM